MLRTYLIRIDGAHDASQGRFVLSQAKVYALKWLQLPGEGYMHRGGYDSQARGICLEVIVDEYYSL